MQNPSKNVKWYKNVFLEQINHQTGIRLLGGPMDKLVGKAVEFRRAVFIKYDCVHFLDIPVAEFLPFLSLHPFILAEQKIR